MLSPLSLQDLPEVLDQVENLWIGHFVIDPQPILAADHQAGPAQHVQVLGYVGLALIQHSLDVANAAFTLAQQLQDLQACRVGQGVESNGL